MTSRFGFFDSGEALYRTDEGGDPFTMPEFDETNRDAPIDPEDRAAMLGLAVGASVTLGGGAQAVTVITRVR